MTKLYHLVCIPSGIGGAEYVISSNRTLEGARAVFLACRGERPSTHCVIRHGGLVVWDSEAFDRQEDRMIVLSWPSNSGQLRLDRAIERRVRCHDRDEMHLQGVTWFTVLNDKTRGVRQ